MPIELPLIFFHVLQALSVFNVLYKSLFKLVLGECVFCKYLRLNGLNQIDLCMDRYRLSETTILQSRATVVARMCFVKFAKQIRSTLVNVAVGVTPTYLRSNGLFYNFNSWFTLKMFDCFIALHYKIRKQLNTDQ